MQSSQTQQLQKQHHTIPPVMLLATMAARPTPKEEDMMSYTQWMFGDSRAETHHFFEHAKERAPKEMACAAMAALLVSPIVSIIDKAIVQTVVSTSKSHNNNNTVTTLLSSAKRYLHAMSDATGQMIRQPKAFFWSGLGFRLTVGVYFGTYAVANLSELLVDIKRVHKEDQRKEYKVTATSIANIGLLAWRDSVFARTAASAAAVTNGHTSGTNVLSTKTSKLPTPLRSLGLFAVRDATTMYATFYTAPQVAIWLQENYGIGRTSAELGSALGIPVLAQFLTAPLHIHAMDVYARQYQTSTTNTSTTQQKWKQSLGTIRAEYMTVAFARGIRILPAFGLGSFANNRFRESMIRHDYDPEPDPTKLTRRLTKVFLGDTTMKKIEK